MNNIEAYESTRKRKRNLAPERYTETPISSIGTLEDLSN